MGRTSTQFLKAIAAVKRTAISELSPLSLRRWTRICQTRGSFAHSSSELTHSPISQARRRLRIRWLVSATRCVPNSIAERLPRRRSWRGRRSRRDGIIKRERRETHRGTPCPNHELVCCKNALKSIPPNEASALLSRPSAQYTDSRLRMAGRSSRGPAIVSSFLDVDVHSTSAKTLSISGSMTLLSAGKCLHALFRAIKTLSAHGYSSARLFMGLNKRSYPKLECPSLFVIVLCDQPFLWLIL